MGREWKNLFPRYGNGKGMKKSIPIIRERESEAFILGNGREREFPLTPGLNIRTDVLLRPIWSKPGNPAQITNFKSSLLLKPGKKIRLNITTDVLFRPIWPKPLHLFPSPPLQRPLGPGNGQFQFRAGFNLLEKLGQVSIKSVKFKFWTVLSAG